MSLLILFSGGGGASGAMSGTASITFSQSATLVGAGALAGSTTVTFGQTGALTGAGALSGSTTLTFDQIGAIAGSGALAGSTTLTFDQIGAIAGSGALAGSTTITFGQSGALVGAGALAGSTSVTFTPSGTLDAPSGSMSGSATLTFSPAGTLTGAGALSGSTTLTFDAAITIPQTDTGSGGWPSAEEYRRYRRLLERQHKIEERKPEPQDRAVPVVAVETIRKIVRRDYAELMAMADEARTQRLRAQMQAEAIRYRQVYEDFLRAELERFREEEAVMMLMLISATVH